jgi:hypothetical protein
MTNIIAFAKAGAPRAIQTGDRIEVALNDWERGDFTTRATVKSMRAGQVIACTDDGLTLSVPLADCTLIDMQGAA